MSDENVTRIPTKPRPKDRPTFSVVDRFMRSTRECPHMHFELDERMAEVTCSDCHAKLNPMWVLGVLASEDNRLRDSWASLRASIHAMRERLRVKCQHCHKFTPLRSGLSWAEHRDLADRFKRGEEPGAE